MEKDQLKIKTPRMLALLESEKAFCTSLAKNKEAFKKILYQIQLELVNEDNKDSIGPVIYGMKLIDMQFEDVIIFGEALIEQENKKKK